MATIKRKPRGFPSWKRCMILLVVLTLTGLGFLMMTDSLTIDSTVLLVTETVMEDPSKSDNQHRQAAAEDSPVDSPVDNRRRVTEAGVDVSDPALWGGVDLQGDSSTATVMGMASNYDLYVYQRFVGSLRRSGFKGNIILGVQDNLPPKIRVYFAFRHVRVKTMKWGDCTYRKPKSAKTDIFKNTECEVNYPDIKVRWSRFPLQADWLRECEECTGPVLSMDVRDSYFQLDPFGPGSPVVKGLQVYEEDPKQTTQHWLASWPIGTCKGIQLHETMLCSGTTIGTRTAILKYWEVMYAEMKQWIANETCRFDINGDDQSIHNYLYYTGQLPFAKAYQNRKGGIVNTVGKTGSDIWNAHMKALADMGVSKGQANTQPYEGATTSNWLGTKYNLTNKDGWFVEEDGSLSRVVHQFDRFGAQFHMFLGRADFILDEKKEFDAHYGALEKLEKQVKLMQIPPPSTKEDEKWFDPDKSEKRKTSVTGVDVSDPELMEVVDLQGDSSTATVMGMASGYDLPVYERFVGTLRKSGFKGKIILGVAPDVKQEVLDYFKYRDVTPKILHWANCTYEKIGSDEQDIFKQTTCEEHYPDIKIRWSRFPLQADWLRECEECTGPVLVMDVRDSYFQLDPFGPGSPPVQGIQVFEEHPSQTTDHWLAKWPIKQCKNVDIVKPMLCSGTTIGTRKAMLKYLDVMYSEMKSWITTKTCRFDVNGDDQSIHNYLYYTGQLPFARAIPFRGGGIVNTVGKLGAIVNKEHELNMLKTKNLKRGDAMWEPFPGATDKTWIGAPYDIADDEGNFLELDGSRSRVIHQWDRFGRPLVNLWMDKNPYFKDPMPYSKLKGLFG